jgi:glycolate oxidase
VTTTQPETVVDGLLDVLPAASVDLTAAGREAASTDASGWGDGVGPAAVVRPGTVEEVAALLQWAQAHRVPVVPRGAGTGLAGAASGTAGSVVLATDRLARISHVDVEDGVAVVEPGVVTADLDDAARAHGLFYAPDPASWRRSTIGGNIATNAGGLRCVKYGVTRESVLGLEVVLPGGALLRTGRRSIKGVAGLDLTGLFVGSEGTLGVVVSATLRLRPVPVEEATLVGVFPDVASAAAAVAALGTAPVAPSVLELLGDTAVERLRKRSDLSILRAGAVLLLVQTDGHGAQAEARAVTEVLERAGGEVQVAQDAGEAEELLDLRRSWGLDPQRRFLIGEDVAVPRGRLVEIVTEVARIADRHGLGHVLAAHAGDGNLHPGFDVAVDDPRGDAELQAVALAAADDLVAATLRLGGTLTGEHGIGVLKRRWVRDELGDVSLDLHRRIKAVFDPVGILNPGKGW